MLKLKKINCTVTRLFFFHVDIEKVLVSNNISFGEKNYMYFIGYLYNVYKVEALHIMILKTSAYVKIYNERTKWMFF